VVNGVIISCASLWCCLRIFIVSASGVSWILHWIVHRCSRNYSVSFLYYDSSIMILFLCVLLSVVSLSTSADIAFAVIWFGLIWFGCGVAGPYIE
jgi:EamA domain-containing membrane protein RarD